jgi:hypothetical protein
MHTVHTASLLDCNALLANHTHVEMQYLFLHYTSSFALLCVVTLLARVLDIGEHSLECSGAATGVSNSS